MSKCAIESCYKTATIYGHCLVCWNKMEIPKRNEIIRSKVEYGKWQLDDIKDIVLDQIEMQDTRSFWSNPDMSPMSLGDILESNHYGYYFPPKDRIFYSGTLDVRNDGPVEEASLCIPANSDIKYEQHGKDYNEVLANGIERNMEFSNFIQRLIYLRKTPKPPKGYVCSTPGDWYILTYGMFVKNLDVFNLWNKKMPEDQGIFYEKNYIKINWANEDVGIGIKRGLTYKQDGPFIRKLKRRVLCLTSMAVSADADSKNLWNVRAFKHVNGKTIQGNLRFGVYGEHVKSLFFARDLPLTEMGRKKPILHWVQAHKRRVAEGVEIDIDKYLRGTRLLEIGDFKFIITKPCEKEIYDFPSWSRKIKSPNQPLVPTQKAGRHS